MRRNLAASLLGAVLLTASPAFAADDTTVPSLMVSAETIAATTARSADTPAAVDFSARSTYRYERPSLLPALYATSAVLQGYDAYSTLTAVNAGAVEANPMMQTVVKSPTAFVAMKASVTAASILAAERLWKNHHRMGAIGLMVASNVIMGVVAANNARVLSTVR